MGTQDHAWVLQQGRGWINRLYRQYIQADGGQFVLFQRAHQRIHIDHRAACRIDHIRPGLHFAQQDFADQATGIVIEQTMD